MQVTWKTGILVLHGVEAGVVAKRSLGAELVEIHVAFEHDLRMRRHFEIHRLALHQLHRLAPQEAGDDVLLNLRRRGHDRGERRCRIGPDRNCDLQPSILSGFRCRLAASAYGSRNRVLHPARLRHRATLAAADHPCRVLCSRAHDFGNAPRLPFAVANASPLSAHRKPACDTFRCCASLSADPSSARRAA